jgi:hypothetical protein
LFLPVTGFRKPVERTPVVGWKPQFNDSRVASVRYRCLNPLAELRRRGFPAELFTLQNLAKYSAVIFSKSYDEKSYELALDLKRRKKKVIFDICDNHFYNPYHLEKFDLVRKRLLLMLSVADLVVTSTETLARVICEEAGIPSALAVVGDPIEEEDFLLSSGWLRRIVERFQVKKERSNRKATLLWFGVHGGENAAYGMLDILNVADTLVKIYREYPFRLVVVSNSRRKYRKYIQTLPFETRYYEWGYVPFRRLLKQADVNIVPITTNPFTLCKSNNRLALALYEGVPSVADEIPSYREFSPFCILNDWEGGLRLYLSNKAIVKEHVASARNYIGNRLMITHIADQWQATLSKFLQ